MAVRRTRRTPLLAIGLVAALGATLTACSGDPEGEAAGPDGVTTVTFAASTFGDPGRGPQLEALVDEFNASQDSVRVAPAAVPYPTFGQTVLTQMGSGRGPDLVRFDMPEFAAAAEAGLLTPIDDLVDVEGYELLEQPDQFMFSEDTRYGVIFEASNYAMFYNADLIPEPPTTYEEFLSTAQSLRQGETYGLAFRTTEAEEAGVWQDIFNYVYGFGGAWSDGENLTIDSPENLEGLEAFQELYDAEVIPQGADAATFRRMFAEGQVGMELNNGGYATATKGQNAELNFDVAPIPFPERTQGAILAPIVVNEASPAKEAAATFIEWILQEENQVKLQEVLGASSVATATERSAASLEESPYLPVFDELTESSLPQIVLGYEALTPDIRRIVVQNVIAALQGEQTMQEALTNAQEEAEALVG